jgi:hypothetical protein
LTTSDAAASRCIKVASSEGKVDGIALSCSRKARRKELPFLTTSYAAASRCIKVASIEGKTEGIALSCSKKASGKTQKIAMCDHQLCEQHPSASSAGTWDWPGPISHHITQLRW